MSDDERTDVSRKLEDIKNLLSGNPWDKNDDGIIGRLWKLEKIVYRYVWMGAGIALAISTLVTVIGIWIEFQIMRK